MSSSVENKFISDAIVDLLPDDPKMATALLALTYANIIVSTGCSDQGAHDALTVALRQMRSADRSSVHSTRGSA